jgi:hypothetical protein
VLAAAVENHLPLILEGLVEVLVALHQIIVMEVLEMLEDIHQ